MKDMSISEAVERLSYQLQAALLITAQDTLALFHCRVY
ncbi:MAG: hypothetical protein H6Q63_1066 [Firmicutes bacterium]|nr:hypothetical protein [Bacillota bacterium]